MQTNFKTMRSLRFLFSLSVLLLSSPSFAEEQKLSNNCKLLGDSLYNCTPYECETKTSENIPVKNKIIGLNSDDECVQEQSNADGDKVLCRYSEESRKFLALRMKKYNTDLASMPEGSEFEEAILADIFHNECDVTSPKQADDKPSVTDEDPDALDADYNEDESETSSVSMDDDTAEGDKTVAPISDEQKVEDNGDLTEGE